MVKRTVTKAKPKTMAKVKPKDSLKQNHKDRGPLLTVWLILMLIGNIFSLFFFLVVGKLIPKLFLMYPNWVLYTFEIMTVLELILTICLFFWKKWAFYVLCVFCIIALVINVFVMKSYASILGIVGPIILYLIMRPKWNLFN